MISFSQPIIVAAADYSHCATAINLVECSGFKDCNWDTTSNACVPNYKFTSEYGDTVSETILYNPEIDPLKNKFTDIGSLTNALLPYLLTGAGLILFAMLISGGFSMLTAATDPKKAEVGKQRITAAFVGFIIIFAAYWLTQILEIILGISIL